MKYVYLEVDGDISLIAFSKLSEIMTDQAICELMSKMETEYCINVYLSDDRRAKIRQDNLIVAYKSENFLFTLRTEIPVSTRIYVTAASQEDAIRDVEFLIAQGKIDNNDTPNLLHDIEGEIQYWMTQTEEEDWQVVHSETL